MNKIEEEFKLKILNSKKIVKSKIKKFNPRINKLIEKINNKIK